MTAQHFEERADGEHRGTDPWPSNGGELGAMIRAFDWTSTPLGPSARWPQSLRTTTELLLQSPVPMVLRWGQDGVAIYNDAYAAFAGRRHPSLLGAAIRDGWPEAIDFSTDVLEAALAGRPLTYLDREFTLSRHGVPEKVWVNLYYSPVHDESGAPAGVLGIVTETTERIRLERDLRHERDRARRVLDSMGEGFVFLDREFRVVQMNAAGLRLDRRPPEQILGRTHGDAWPDSEHSEVGRLYRHAMSAGASVTLEHRYVFDDGREAWIEVRAHPSDDGLAVFYRDVTERHRAEATLRESETHHRNIVELNPQVIWTATVDGQLDRVAERWNDWTGTTGLGSSWGNALFPDDLPPTVAAWTRSVTTGEPYDIEHRIRLRNGAFHWMHSRASAYRDADGRIVKWYGSTEDIHDRKKAQAALAASEARLRTIADSIDQMIWSTRADGYHDYFNARWYEYTGTVAGSTDGDAWAGLFHADDQENIRVRWEHSLATGEPYEIRYRLRHRSGAYRWVLGRAQPARNPAGRITRWYGTCTDIHEQACAEQALRDSEQRLLDLNADLERQVVERAKERALTWQVSPDLLSVFDRVGRFEATNPAWTATLGWSEESLVGQPFAAFVHPDDVERTMAAWAGARRGKPVLRFENRYRAVDGSYRWLSWVSVPAGDHIYCSARDVTVEKGQAADLLARTAERDRLWNNTQDLQAVIDHAGTFRAVNPAFTSVLGWESADVVGRTVFDFVLPDDATVTSDALNTARGQALPVVENRYRHKDGGVRWISWVATPEGDLIYASGRHVTAEKEQAVALAIAQEALRQSQKMEAVGQLTGGIAHDFNNMLAVVIGSLDLLGRRLGSADPRARRYVDAATDGAKRAALLTKRLLAFSRQQPLQPEPLDANKLVAGMSDLLGHSLGADVQLEIVLAGGLWRTYADPNQLENVVLNLAVNARDAMPSGGHLTIETQNTHLDDRYVAAHYGLPAGQYILIAVTDNGAGMAQDVVAKAFDPFFTTKGVGKGTGLGLSQVYGFVKQSSGHVKIYSEPGQGTTVKVYLPRYAGSVQDVVPDGGTTDDPAQGESAEVILVVEDEPAVRQFSIDALTALGYRVLEADGAAAALRLLAAHDEIVLMFTDIVMPEVNGARLAEEARRSRPDLKVLFTTGYTRNAVVHNGVVDAGVQLIGKPFTVDELATKVREVLDQPA